jgi:hypothetical protein
MAAKKKAQEDLFNIGVLKFKDYTGKGEVYTLHRTPSSVINALNAQTRGVITQMEVMYAMLYYTLKATTELDNALATFIPDEDAARDVQSGVQYLADRYVLTGAECHDDGEVAEENPTQAN